MDCSFRTFAFYRHDSPGELSLLLLLPDRNDLPMEISAGQTVMIGDSSFSLNLDDGILCLTVDSAEQ